MQHKHLLKKFIWLLKKHNIYNQYLENINSIDATNYRYWSLSLINSHPSFFIAEEIKRRPTYLAINAFNLSTMKGIKIRQMLDLSSEWVNIITEHSTKF